MSHIYIISDLHLMNFNVGCHTGTIDELIDKYITDIPELSINLFLQANNAEELEKKVRNLYGDQSGWYTGIRLIDLTYLILHNAVGISDQEMFHYKLKTHNSDPLDKFILELRYNTANGLRDEVIYVEPRKTLDLDDIYNMYRVYRSESIGYATLSLDKLSLKERLKKHGYKSDNDDVLPGNIIRTSSNHETIYKIKLGLCLWNYIL